MDRVIFVNELDEYLIDVRTKAWEGMQYEINHFDVMKVCAIGKCRGGDDNVGGMVWLDFNLEFKSLPIVPQIVGHTRGKEVRTMHPADPEFDRDDTDDICLDSGLKHVAVVYKDRGVDVCKLPPDWVVGDGRG
jgi:hypothetical protein